MGAATKAEGAIACLIVVVPVFAAPSSREKSLFLTAKKKGRVCDRESIPAWTDEDLSKVQPDHLVWITMWITKAAAREILGT